MPENGEKRGSFFARTEIQNQSVNQGSSIRPGGWIAWFFTWVIPIIPLMGVFGKVIKFILAALGIFLILSIIFIGIAYGYSKYQTGQTASAVVHGGVAVEEGLSPIARSIKGFSPELYAVFYPSSYNPYAIDSSVEVNANNKDVGVRITEFKPVGEFFRPNSDIRLIGKIKAKGLDRPSTIEVYCSLDDYRSDAIIPAELLGPGTNGNKGRIVKDQAAEFIANCNFPGGISVNKQLTTKVAKLVIVYEFETKAYERVWFLPSEEFFSLQNSGVNPFKYYSINDPLLDGEGKIKSKSTPGPINLGMQIDFPQPLIDQTKYLLMVQLSRNFAEGNLQTLESVKVQVPSVDDLEIVLEGERGFEGSSQCDFEYVGETEEGYKEYQLLDLKRSEVNQNCDKKSLRELALSESDCIEFYKEPLFVCNFMASNVPDLLNSDIIKAEARYTYKVEKQRAVDIRALGSELVVG